VFLENIKSEPKSGWIEVICGSMFSGKTEELIRRLRRAHFAKQKVEIFKPAIDTRYHEEQVVSHNSNSIPSTPVPSSSNILLLANDSDVVGIDEAQFFDNELVDMDYTGKPFGPIPALLACAEYVTKVHAICMNCGNLAQFSHRKTDQTSLVLLGETDSYEPLCRKCYQKITS
jgi:thymidine kinase